MNGHLMRSGHFGALMESFYGRRSGHLRRTSVSSFPAPYWLLTSMGHQCDSSCSSCPATCGLILLLANYSSTETCSKLQVPMYLSLSGTGLAQSRFLLRD